MINGYIASDALHINVTCNIIISVSICAKKMLELFEY